MTNYTSQADEALFAAFGRATISWGHIEYALDVFVMILHWRLGGQQTVERIIPWSLSRKLDYIKRYFRKHYPSYPATKQICDLMDQISSASESRHDLLHGFVIEHAEGASEAKLVRLLRDSGGGLPRERHITVTTTTVLQNAIDPAKLGAKLIHMVNSLVEAFPRNEANKPSG